MGKARRLVPAVLLLASLTVGGCGPSQSYSRPGADGGPGTGTGGGTGGQGSGGSGGTISIGSGGSGGTLPIGTGGSASGGRGTGGAGGAGGAGTGGIGSGGSASGGRGTGGASGGGGGAGNVATGGSGTGGAATGGMGTGGMGTGGAATGGSATGGAATGGMGTGGAGTGGAATGGMGTGGAATGGSATGGAATGGTGTGGAATGGMGTGGAGTGGAPAPAIISIDFVGGRTAGSGIAMAATESAGVKPATNWNSAAGPMGTNAALVFSTGVASGASVVWNAPTVAPNPGIWSISYTDAPGDIRMMAGYLDPTWTSVPATAATLATVSGLPPAISAAPYDVYVYVLGDSPTDMRTYQYGIGSTTFTVVQNTAPSLSPPTPYPYAVAPDMGMGTHVIFRGVTGASFALTVKGLSGTGNRFRAPVNGIQIVSPTGS